MHLYSLTKLLNCFDNKTLGPPTVPVPTMTCVKSSLGVQTAAEELYIVKHREQRGGEEAEGGEQVLYL